MCVNLNRSTAVHNEPTVFNAGEVLLTTKLE